MQEEPVVNFSLEDLIKIRAALSNTEKTLLRISNQSPQFKLYCDQQLEAIIEGKKIITDSIKREFNPK
jgi:hypothetical protein